MSRKRMADFEKHLCGGKTPWRLYQVKDDGVLVGYDFWVIDADLDAYCVSVDCDGYMQINTSDYEHFTVSPEMLWRMASLAELAKAKIDAANGRTA